MFWSKKKNETAEFGDVVTVATTLGGIDLREAVGFLGDFRETISRKSSDGNDAIQCLFHVIHASFKASNDGAISEMRAEKNLSHRDFDTVGASLFISLLRFKESKSTYSAMDEMSEDFNIFLSECPEWVTDLGYGSRREYFNN